MRKRLLSSIIVIICLLIPLSSFALETALAKRVVKVAMLNYANFIEREEDGTISGYAEEYLSDIADYTGWTYEYIDMSFSDALDALHNGEVDIVAGVQKTSGRDELYDFSKLSMGQNSALLCVAKEDNRYAYQDYDNFAELRVGGIKGSADIELCKSFMNSKNVNVIMSEFSTDEEASEALARVEIDAFLMNTIRYHDDYKVITRLTPTDMYFACNPKDPTIKEALDEAQQQIHENNRYYELGLDKNYFNDIQDSQVFSKAELAFIDKLKEVNLGYVSQQDPVSYQDQETKEFAGMTRAILDKISSISNLKFNYIALPAGAIDYDYLRDNHIGLVSSVEYNDINLKLKGLHLSNPYLSAQKVFVGPSNKTFDKDSNLTVAMATGSGSVQTFLQTKYPNFKIKGYDNVEDCFQAILDGEADLLMQNQYVVTYLLSKPQYEDLSAYPVEGLSDQLCISSIYLLDKNGKVDEMLADPLLISIINKSIAQISEDEISQIVAKYTTGKPYHLTSQDIIYKYRTPIIIIALLLFVCFAMLIMIISIRQKNTKKIEEQNKLLVETAIRAEHASQAKSQFLARMSHEIRTPMNAIVGLCEIAKHQTEDKAKIDDYLMKIDSSAKILLGIINDVLDMSAIESNKLKIANNSFDLKALLSSVSTLYYIQCKNKNIHFEMFSSDVSEEILIGDALRLNQILLNLLSNAYKFTPKGGTIKVVVSQESGKNKQAYFRFEVMDSGCGMSEEMQERLFQPFEQESALTALHHGGSGLGLSITKNLVDMMHGVIKVESKKNEGTKFIVEIPFDTETKTVEDNEDKFKTIRALIVDDDKSTLEYTSIVLDRIGVYYDCASNGEEAIQYIKDAHKEGKGYDICFVDWKMPKANGIEVTKQIRALYNEDTIIIIVSAYDLSEVEEEAKAAGANMFISKPLFQSTVYNVLMTLSGGKYIKNNVDEKAYDFKGRRILLAEDNELNREIAVDLLEMVNLKVDCACNGEEAVALFEKSTPGYYDAILMDIQMPIIDGHQATKQIRKLNHAQAKSIPIYAMTANAFSEDISAAYAVGMNGHIAKPIDTKALYQTLEECFKENENEC